MYDEIFDQITIAANKRNLRDSTIHAYCISVARFLKYTVVFQWDFQMRLEVKIQPIWVIILYS